MKLHFILVLALAATCLADQSITDRVTGYVTDSALARAREATGIDGLNVDSLKSQEGLTDLATGIALDKAGNLIGVNGLTVDQLRTRQGLTDLATGVALDRAGNLIGVDGLTVDQLKSREGLTNIATGAAGAMLGVQGLTMDQLKTKEGLKALAINGTKSMVSNAIGATPIGTALNFGMAAAGYENPLGKPSALTPAGLAVKAGSLANSAIKSIWSSDDSSSDEQ